VSLVAASAIALGSMPACATYEGSRDTAVGGGATFATGMAVWIYGGQAESAGAAYTGIAIGAASMIVMMSSGVGMITLPPRVEVALRIAHELRSHAEEGDCTTVAARKHEVEDLDPLVYEVVLMEDPVVIPCFEPSSPASSPQPPLPAGQARPDRESMSIVR
jgi:hypothetical protein